MKSYQVINSSRGNGIWQHAKRSLITLITSAAMFGAFSTSSFALRDTDPTDPGPIILNVSGVLMFRGCQPTANDVTVRIGNPARSGHPSAPSRLPDGSIRMTYSITVGSDTDPNLPDQVVVTPQVSASVCGAGSFTSGSRTVETGATGVNFDYQVAATGQFTIPSIHSSCSPIASCRALDSTSITIMCKTASLLWAVSRQRSTSRRRRRTCHFPCLALLVFSCVT